MKKAASRPVPLDCRVRAQWPSKEGNDLSLRMEPPWGNENCFGSILFMSYLRVGMAVGGLLFSGHGQCDKKCYADNGPSYEVEPYWRKWQEEVVANAQENQSNDDIGSSFFSEYSFQREHKICSLTWS